jgi:hypothetical protein
LPSPIVSTTRISEPLLEFSNRAGPPKTSFISLGAVEEEEEEKEE